jgi:hypothetical protein
MLVIVAPRVLERHPDLTEEDVVHAVEQPFHSQPRLDEEPTKYVGVGPDTAGRAMEWIAVPLLDVTDGWYVYHAQRPPTKKVLNELGMI